MKHECLIQEAGETALVCPPSSCHCYTLHHIFREVKGKSGDLTLPPTMICSQLSQHENSYCKDTCQEGSHMLSDKPALPPALSLNFKFYPVKYLFLSAKSKLSRDIFKNGCPERLLYVLAPGARDLRRCIGLRSRGFMCSPKLSFKVDLRYHIGNCLLHLHL